MEDGIRQSTVGCTLNAQITTRVLPNSSSVYPCIAQFHPVKTRYFTSNHVDCLVISIEGLSRVV
ncbi:hypothetical protein C5167_021645 [Papaver somniferum]|nr:hypothetical protein C5167_021645 [Papaver somniferum]